MGKKQLDTCLRFKSSLSASFLLVIAVTYIVVSSVTFYAFSSGVKKISTRYAAKFSVSQNLLEKNRIMSIVERELALSLKLADDPQIKAWMQDEENHNLKESAFLQLESYRRHLRDKALFAAVRSSGNYYARTPATTGMMASRLDPENPADRWFYRSLEENNDYSLNVDYNAMLKENRVWINVIVRDSMGDAAGIAGCGMDLTAFLEALVAHEEPGISTILINKAGELQAHIDRSLIDHNAEVTKDSDKIDIYSLITAESDRVLLKKAISAAGPEQQPAVFPITYRGRKVLCSIGPLPGLDWYNIVLVDEGSILNIRDFIPIGIVILLSLLAVLASVLFSMNHLIIKPIGKLTNASSLVAGGAYDINLPVTGNNEVAVLSRSFNTMTEKVRAYTHNLEELVEQRTRQLQDTNMQLEESRRKIIDSIEYASLIQNSILPSEEELSRNLKDWFYILKPLDLVGGDFIFFRETGDGFILAVIDCTGHGVPGAFMTMMVNALLNRITETMPESGPADMLKTLHRLVQDTLRSRSGMEHVENGLDISFCRFRNSRQKLEFCGAGLPLYIELDGEVSEITGNRIHIGFSSSRDVPEWKEYDIPVKEGQVFYLLSDGVLDLPGGEKGFGLGRNQLKKLLKTSASISPSGREKFLRQELGRHQGDNSQRDDYTLIGFRLRFQEEM